MTLRCACGWTGDSSNAAPNASGIRCCPKCGGSGGIVTYVIDFEAFRDIELTRPKFMDDNVFLSPRLPANFLQALVEDFFKTFAVELEGRGQFHVTYRGGGVWAARVGDGDSHISHDPILATKTLVEHETQKLLNRRAGGS
jgi:hypothetical protein